MTPVHPATDGRRPIGRQPEQNDREATDPQRDRGHDVVGQVMVGDDRQLAGDVVGRGQRQDADGHVDHADQLGGRRAFPEKHPQAEEGDCRAEELEGRRSLPQHEDAHQQGHDADEVDQIGVRGCRQPFQREQEQNPDDGEVADPDPEDVGPHLPTESSGNALATQPESVQGQQAAADGDLQPDEGEGWNIPQRKLCQHAGEGRREQHTRSLGDGGESPVHGFARMGSRSARDLRRRAAASRPQSCGAIVAAASAEVRTGMISKSIKSSQWLVQAPRSAPALASIT